MTLRMFAVLAALLVQQLPPPFQTPWFRKGTRVVPMPEGHQLTVPAGFKVNVFADVKRESVQPSQETILTRAPQVILEIRANQTPVAADARRDHDVWNALSSLPAVRQRRVHFLAGSPLVVPGPRVTEGVEMMARALHPDAFR